MSAAVTGSIPMPDFCSESRCLGHQSQTFLGLFLTCILGMAVDVGACLGCDLIGRRSQAPHCTVISLGLHGSGGFSDTGSSTLKSCDVAQIPPAYAAWNKNCRQKAVMLPEPRARTSTTCGFTFTSFVYYGSVGVFLLFYVFTLHDHVWSWSSEVIFQELWVMEIELRFKAWQPLLSLLTGPCKHFLMLLNCTLKNDQNKPSLVMK